MRYSNSFIAKIAFLVIGSIIGIGSLIYSNYIASELAHKEHREVQLWSHSMRLQALGDGRSALFASLVDENTSIPAIIIDEFLQVQWSQNIDSNKINKPKRLRSTLEKMASADRPPIVIQLSNGRSNTVFYDESLLLQGLYWFPLIQIVIIGVFLMLAMMTFRSAQQSEQNKIWVGMSKETAHQLGTPTSSLLGWVEYLRTQPSTPEIVDEMDKDIIRLMKVAERFSKIGSTTITTPTNIYHTVQSVTDYFQTRIPKAVFLKLQSTTDMPLQALINPSLFEWVLENLFKNALDALAGKGYIDVTLSQNSKYIIIDVKDTGKGIPKTSWKTIFKPGYTTKTRGWGLGLSLSKRIVEQYHKGKIFVLSSETDKGSIFRIELKKL